MGRGEGGVTKSKKPCTKIAGPSTRHNWRRKMAREMTLKMRTHLTRKAMMMIPKREAYDHDNTDAKYFRETKTNDGGGSCWRRQKRRRGSPVMVRLPRPFE
jgi:hypothetical protein